MNRVFILGGGVAGLSAAHELAERGLEVVVFERQPICGGKARSMAFAGSGSGGRPDWPGEHGFRFFPGFYFHITDTMSRIVVDPVTGTTAADHLVTASEIGIGQDGKPMFRTVATHPQTFEEWVTAIRQLFSNPSLGVPQDEVRVFLQKLLCFLGAGRKRRLQQYEGISWWNFIEAPGKSPAYQDILARGLSQSLVAMRPDRASTLTVASMLVQIVVNIVRGEAADRLLNAPTNDAWIDPWVARLGSNPTVTLLTSHKARRLNFDSVNNTVTSVDVEDGMGNELSFGDAQDYYIAAVPVEVLQQDTTLFPQSFKIATGLTRPVGGVPAGGVDKLETEWMNGVLFYLNRDVSSVRGHAIYANSTWALTSISQRQFWGAAYPWANRGNGLAQDILSTIISDWNRPGTKTTTSHARNATRQQILEEAWAQLKAHLALEGTGALNDSDLAAPPGTSPFETAAFIDPAIKFDAPGPGGKVTGNDEPLLINTAGSRVHRPSAVTNVPNFMVAADYVLTETDLACMEAANEAARAAVNAVLAQSGSTAPPCVIKPLEEPDVFRAFQAIDDVEFPINPSQAPVLCRHLDQLLPSGPPPPPGSSPLTLLLGASNVILLLVILYLLLRS
jgi:uncharacterized protein with NAD-binding domain and iron-sulfur cluster